MQTITKHLTDIVLQVVQELDLAQFLSSTDEVQITKNTQFGDVQSNHAFQIAKAKRCNPRDVANQMKSELEKNGDIQKMCTEISVAGPGFLNFRFSNTWLAEKLKEQVMDAHCGIQQTGNSKTMVIDYSSPNVAKRMHIGHMRSTIIGSAIDKLYRASGWNVVADNHIGDWGTQFGKLIVSWRESVDMEHFQEDAIGELERLYVLFGQTETPERLEMARQETAKLQSGDPENTALWKNFIDVSLAEFNSVYSRMGIHFDVILGESFYNPQLAGVVDSLVNLQVAENSNGAVVIRYPADSTPKMLSDTALVIQKQDGAFLYGTTDLATLEYRIAEWKPDEIVYVTDVRQQLHFQQVFAGWKKWRLSRGETVEMLEHPQLTHVWFGMLKLPEGAMSTRQGNVIRLVDLLDEAVHRAKIVADEKSADLSLEDREKIAEAVGLSAIRYADLSQNPQTDVVFEWDKILSLEGNTAPFLLYSYARARGIQRKGGVEIPTVSTLEILEPTEKELAMLLLQFPMAVQNAQTSHRPNMLCEYLFDVASSFNRFYFANPVLTASEEQVKQARLALVESMLRVMKKGLDILGLIALDRM